MRFSHAEFTLPADGLLEIELGENDRARPIEVVARATEPVLVSDGSAAARDRAPVLSAASRSSSTAIS